MQYEWHEEKAAKNKKKHGVDFEEAKSIFNDPKIKIKYDENNSEEEDRFQAIGYSEKYRCLFVVFCEYEGEGDDTIRIISARCAEKFEEKIYSESAKKRTRIY
ncbi:BrnT family toxin [Pigmentibacter ruber]|uniref:BrnT family toxin n=1 Tax=Pigmentibacter ruber TaxID=2683196 RepID=UPI00131DEDBF